MIPGIYNMEGTQGATFSRPMTWKDGNGDIVDLTDYTAEMQMRATFDADDPVVTLTTENGRIVLGDAENNILLTVQADDMWFEPGQYVYDLFLYGPNASENPLLSGTYIHKPRVTR